MAEKKPYPNLHEMLLVEVSKNSCSCYMYYNDQAEYVTDQVVEFLKANNIVVPKELIRDEEAFVHEDFCITNRRNDTDDSMQCDCPCHYDIESIRK